MSLGCYIISQKKILINKEAVKDVSRYFSPEEKVIKDDYIFIYGDEDKNQLIEKILSVDETHRCEVFTLIYGTLGVYYEDRVRKTLEGLKKLDVNCYNKIKKNLYPEDKKQSNDFLKDNLNLFIFLISVITSLVATVFFILYFTDKGFKKGRLFGNTPRVYFKTEYLIYSVISFFTALLTFFYVWKNNYFKRK